MFRIIAAVSSPNYEKKNRFMKIGSVFGGRKALHGTPRRYKRFDSALERALSLSGKHTIMDDKAMPCAVVEDGEVLLFHPKYDPHTLENQLRRMILA